MLSLKMRRRKKEIGIIQAVVLQTEKVMAPVHGKCLDKIANTLNAFMNVGMQSKNHSTRRVWYYPQFYASIGGL